MRNDPSTRDLEKLALLKSAGPRAMKCHPTKNLAISTHRRAWEGMLRQAEPWRPPSRSDRPRGSRLTYPFTILCHVWSTPQRQLVDEGPLTWAANALCGLQNRIVDHVSQGSFLCYEPARERLGAALAHSGHPLVDLLSLARTWPIVPPGIRDAILAIASATVECRRDTSKPRHR